jgi:hypothetical protein
MLKAIAAGLAVTMMLVAGCSSEPEDSQNAFSCDTAQSKCPNDPPPDRAECKRILEDPTCGNVFMGLLLCAAQHQACLSDGKTDESVIRRECAMQVNAADQCASTIDAGGGG